jgi:hypothetical protein
MLLIMLVSPETLWPPSWPWSGTAQHTRNDPALRWSVSCPRFVAYATFCQEKFLCVSAGNHRMVISRDNVIHNTQKLFAFCLALPSALFNITQAWTFSKSNRSSTFLIRFPDKNCVLQFLSVGCGESVLSPYLSKYFAF